MNIGISDVPVTGCNRRYSSEKLLRDNFMTSRATGAGCELGQPVSPTPATTRHRELNPEIHPPSAKRL